MAARRDLIVKRDGGYECEFVEPPPDELVCLICTFVAREAHQLDCCGRVFCKTCLDKYDSKRNVCPACRRRGTAFSDRRGERNILSLKVKCDNAEKGCQWQAELRALDKHHTVCGFVLVSCPQKCTREGSTQQVFRKDLEHHLHKECPNRMYKCIRCGLEGKYVQITVSHVNVCPEMDVTCPNKCGEQMKRCKLQNHRSTCPKEEVRCKYAELGCKVKRPRKDMCEHETSEKDLHLSCALETVVELKQQSHVTVANPAVVKMSNFSHYKKVIWYSPEFYSHQKGYKMCVSVYANGVGLAKDTHVSIAVQLMRGENDSDLVWPFRGSIEIQLLNQIQDKNHHAKSLTYDGNNESSHRVIDSDRGKSRRLAQFIKHSALKYPSLTCQYLKDDCLRFRINIKVSESNKPWLTSTI